MDEPAIPFVAVDTVSKDREGDTHGPVIHNDVQFLVVNAEQVHVWVNGKHYVEAGTADTVNKGDMFYLSSPELAVWRVREIDESIPSSKPGVEIEIVYPSGSPETDNVSQNVLTGLLNNEPMGYMGPPTLLEESSL